MSVQLEQQPRAADVGGVGLSANAFTELYRQHMPELTRYCRGILRDREDAEDAAQSAMERALRALCAGPAPERMRPWLLTIAQREAINLLRGRRRAARGELDEAVVGLQPSPEELSAIRQRLADLLADLRALTPRQREVLVARELGGRSYREIASSLGTTEAAAQQVVLEARQSLRLFEVGRSLACDDVQSWISAHDHARARTRRVRAHLRSCTSCQGFERGIRRRRRDLALLLPGLGGGAWWSPLAALLGQGGAKAVTAGAVVATGVTLAGAAHFLDRPAPVVSAPAAAERSASAPGPAAPTVLMSGDRPARPARRAQAGPERHRHRARRRAATVTSPPNARSEEAAVAAQHVEPAEEHDHRPAARPPTRPESTPTPSGESSPAPTAAPAPIEDVLSAAKPVTDAVDAVVQTVQDVASPVTDALPGLPGSGTIP